MDYSYSPDRALMDKVVKEAIGDLLDKLSSREQFVLKFRYGLFGEERATLKEIAERLEVSPETVRQIELRAIRKLRVLATDIKDYLVNCRVSSTTGRFFLPVFFEARDPVCKLSILVFPVNCRRQQELIKTEAPARFRHLCKFFQYPGKIWA